LACLDRDTHSVGAHRGWVVLVNKIEIDR
jgi:hypothetical protein